MIQIIGFLLCAALAVKLLEMTANPALYQESGNPKPSTGAALILGWASVFGFAFWLLVQGGAFPDEPAPITETAPLTQEQIECIENAKGTDAVLACAP